MCSYVHKYVHIYCIAEVMWCYHDITILLTDINECLVNNGGCGHNCRNIIGSYNCHCNTGYRLHSDKHKCIGM